MRLRIFDIKRYAIHDGPGIRTTIFLKGCPLRCVWCHNPESWSLQSEKIYRQQRCIGCGSCVEACPNKALGLTAEGLRLTGIECRRCGKCAEACPSKALEMCGSEWELDDLLAEVEKERDVMTIGEGGVTLCGGEPLMHDIVPLLQELGLRGFHRVVDTSLYASVQVVRRVAEECELFLVDIKLMDNEKHRQYTGVSNQIILDNIRLLARMGKPFLVRIPLIEGVNADEDNIDATARFLAELPMKVMVELLPYHDVGKDKHRRLWSQYNPDNYTMDKPDENTIQRCIGQFSQYGIEAREG